MNGESETIRVGDVIIGQTSGTTGVVKTAVVFESAVDNPEVNTTTYVYDVVMDNFNGEFLPGEEIIPQLTPRSLSKFFIAQDEITEPVLMSPISVKITTMLRLCSTNQNLPGGTAQMPLP